MKVWVSLTSIVENLPSLFHTLGSLLNQSMKPDEIVLFLSPMPYLQDSGFKDYKIPQWLDEMPIEIRWVNNVGPYRKLLPLLMELQETDDVIITCDDDTIYHKDFVKKLVRKYEKENCCVAYRCKYWFPGCTYEEMKEPQEKSIQNFHTGKGGVLYSPKFFKDTQIFSNKCLELCPFNDDFWFNFWRMKNKVPCYCLPDPYMIEDLTNPKSALFFNYNQEKNNEQMNATHKYIFQVDEDQNV